MEIDAFVRHGVAVSRFTEAVLLRDTDAAEAEASPVIRKHKLVPKIMDEVEKIIPAGVFVEGPEELRSWSAHHGLDGASDAEKWHFFVMSPQWKPDQVQTIHA